MRFRYLLLTLLVPAMIACAKDDKNNEENNENPQEKPEEPIEEEDAWVIVGLGNDWNTEVAMTKDSKDPNLWTASVTLGAEENEGGIKFRTKGDSEWKSHQFGIDPAAETNTLEFSKKVSTSSVKLVADDGASKNIILRPGEHEYQFKLYVDGDKKGVFTATMTLTDDDIYAPEITNGAKVLACNRDVEKFLTDIQYPTHDYSYSSLRTWAEQNGIAVCPGNSDKPEEYSIRWAADPAAGDVVVTISEPDRSREYTVSSSEHTLTISNLLPNTHYTYQAKAGSKVLTEGSFDTYGKVHQLHFRTQVRNCRDLGGWKTQDGKTVKYRQVYRGGRLEPSYLGKTGKADLIYEGIKAQLDLRGHSDVLSESTLKGIVDDYEFCAPVIEEGYAQMLNDDKEKTRQCMQFIMDCVDKQKPVYFHCSLGRDRTGTVAMLTLGILGVPEGDISQEYEITQFAPNGYATSTGEKTKMVRTVDYKGAANVIWKYVNEAAGETFRDGVEKYLIEIGISKADIDKFRENMLQ